MVALAPDFMPDDVHAEVASLRRDRLALIGKLRTVDHDGHRWKLVRQLEACDRHIARLERLQ